MKSYVRLESLCNYKSTLYIFMFLNDENKLQCTVFEKESHEKKKIPCFTLLNSYQLIQSEDCKARKLVKLIKKNLNIDTISHKLIKKHTHNKSMPKILFNLTESS